MISDRTLLLADVRSRYVSILTQLNVPLTLTLSELTVTLTKFIGDDTFRMPLQQPSSIEFSVNGTPSVSGIAIVPKNLWSVQAIVDSSQKDILDAIIYEFQYLRRNLLDYNVLVTDTTSRLVERTPRSRALAPSTTERLIGNTHTAYFPIFKAVFTEIPKFTLPRDRCSGNQIASFTLVESVRMIP